MKAVLGLESRIRKNAGVLHHIITGMKWCILSESHKTKHPSKITPTFWKELTRADKSPQLQPRPHHTPHGVWPNFPLFPQHIEGLGEERAMQVCVDEKTLIWRQTVNQCQRHTAVALPSMSRGGGYCWGPSSDVHSSGSPSTGLQRG